jgi:hypothetical protein
LVALALLVLVADLVDLTLAALGDVLIVLALPILETEVFLALSLGLEGVLVTDFFLAFGNFL